MTTLPPPLASKQVKQQNYKYLLLPSQVLLLPSQVCGAFYVGPSFDPKRSISKELSFAHKNLQIGITSSLEAELMPRHGAQSKR